jgi:predicted enzyme related to lactoylglutathione lyase
LLDGKEGFPMDSANRTGASTATIECIIPILRVKSLRSSIRFYEEVLGFRLDWGGRSGSIVASVSRDGRAIMLCEGSQGQPGTWIWIGVEDIEPLLKAFAAKGATVLQQPTNYSWAYEMRIEDPDGHVLRFGSDAKKNLPIADAASATS